MRLKFWTILANMGGEQNERAVFLAVLSIVSALVFHGGLLEEHDVGVAYASEDAEWVYYGFCPSLNYTPPPLVTERRYYNNVTRIMVVGYNDSTHVTVYDITGGSSSVLESFTVDRMEAHTTQLSRVEANFSIETYFRVVSDKPVAVLMSGGIYDIYGANVFYPSTDGGFAGREFIVVTAAATDIVARNGWDYAVFAIEDSIIEIRDQDDEVIRVLDAAANSSKRLDLFSNKIYRIRSTGRVFVSSWAGNSLAACPESMGGYSGRLFFSNPYQSALSGSTILLIIAQDSPARVRVCDIGVGSLVAEKRLQSREMWFIGREAVDLEGVRLKVESNEEVVVYAGATVKKEGVPDSPALLANAITFSTIWPDRSTTIFSATDAYVFSPNRDAEVSVNGLKITVPRGSYKNIPSGLITLTSNETVIVETISRQPRISHFATYLLPANRLEVTYPPPKPSEVGPEARLGVDTMLVSAVVALVAVVAAVSIVKKRKSQSY